MLRTAAQRLAMPEQVLSSVAVVAAYLNRIKATAGANAYVTVAEEQALLAAAAADARESAGKSLGALDGLPIGTCASACICGCGCGCGCVTHADSSPFSAPPVFVCRPSLLQP